MKPGIIVADLQNKCFDGISAMNASVWAEKITCRLPEVMASVVRVLEILETDDQFAASIAGQSYRHVNGFYKITLVKDAQSGGCVRIHIWPSGTRNYDGPGDLHDHRWPFVSYILAGEFRERRYLSPPPDHVDLPNATPRMRFLEYNCKSRSSSQEITLNGFSPINLVQSSDVRRCPPDVYSCKAGEIHSFGPESLHLSATLVITGCATKKAARVFKSSEVAPGLHTLNVPSLRIAHLRKVLRSLRGAASIESGTL